ALESLHSHLYGWSYIQHAIPLSESFLGMDLRATPNDVGLLSAAGLMVVLVGLTTWAQTKTQVTVSTDERARAQQQMMAYMMPLMFAFFALSFPSGVALYWVVNSLIGIGFNVATYGFAPLHIDPIVHVRTPATPPTGRSPAPPGTDGSGTGAPARSKAVVSQFDPELRTANGPGRSKRQNRRRRP
ncbi:MAG: YidC/Oxa1 family membrane protein insertase, partial [Hyphomicrobiales bacterium]